MIALVMGLFVTIEFLVTAPGLKRVSSNVCTMAFQGRRRVLFSSFRRPWKAIVPSCLDFEDTL